MPFHHLFYNGIILHKLQYATTYNKEVFPLPLDGIVLKSLIIELNEKLTGGRIEKVFQPEWDEIVLHIRAKGHNYKLLLSANSSNPRVYITGENSINPPVPPMFCMLLRKHLSGGKIINVAFHDYERIVDIHIESIDELGDLSVKRLVAEIMGRYSNIILIGENNRIIDAIKHIDNETSRVREVMPARLYELPPAQDKVSPDDADPLEIVTGNEKSSLRVDKYLLEKIKGFSPFLCREICYRAEIDERQTGNSLSTVQLNSLSSELKQVLEDIKYNKFSPCIIYDSQDMENTLDFHCLNVRSYEYLKHDDSISRIMDLYYTDKVKSNRLSQMKASLLRSLEVILSRYRKKAEIQESTLQEVADREKYRLYGELLTANIYSIPKYAKSARVLNFYSENNEFIDIPLDEHKTPSENAQYYFKKYARAKRTYTSTKEQLENTLYELDYLETVQNHIENCTTVEELEEIRDELVGQNYLAASRKRQEQSHKESLPHHYLSSDGIDIFVGKNNRQNDLLTLKQSSPEDIWLHAKNIPGSHVIVKAKNSSDIPDSTLLEAAMLAAYNSKARMSSNVPVDYTFVKYVRKPKGSKPGMVIYDNYKTINVTPSESFIKNLRRV